MLKKSLMLSAAATLTLASSLAMADSAQTTPQGFKIYTSNNFDSKVIETVPIHKNLTPFYKKDGWIKVGDPSNGNVGWINLKQANEAVKADQPKLHKIVITEKIDGKDGPATTRTIEYYGTENMNKQQVLQIMQNMQRQQQLMKQEVNQEVQSMDNVMMPAPVIIEQDPSQIQRSPQHQEPPMPPAVKKEHKKPGYGEEPQKKNWWQRMFSRD